jgi:hypothetical protein
MDVMRSEDWEARIGKGGWWTRHEEEGDEPGLPCTTLCPIQSEGWMSLQVVPVPLTVRELRISFL